MELTFEEQIELLFAKRDERLLQAMNSALDKQTAEIKALLTKPKSLRIGQNEAWEIYGRADVRAWRLSGQIQAYKMIRRVEYEVARLDELMKQKQLVIKPIRRKV